MFPIRDDNPTLGPPAITVVLIGLNVAAWILVQGMGAEPTLSRSVCELGLIPGELLGRIPEGYTLPMSREMSCVIGPPHWYTPLSSMFLHGGWLHLIGNMWFLWLFGNNVEDSMGRLRFLGFYLLSGLAAAVGQIITSPSSVLPMVGASGAISGVMGAYLVLYPRVRVYVLLPIFIFFTFIALPAWMMLGYWFLLQLVSGLLSSNDVGGVAVWAHVAGFIAGVIMIKLFVRDEYVAA